MSTCQTCSSPTGDSAQLCRTHIGDLRRLLTEVITGPPDLKGDPTPGLAAELETTVIRQDRLQAPQTRSGGEKPLVWNERASNVAVDLHATFNAWALETSRHEEDPRDPLSSISNDTAEVAEWLLRNLTTLAQHPDAGTAFEELRDAVHRARNAVDRPAISSRFFVGPCPEADEDDVPCPGEVWAYIPAVDDKPAMLRCQNDDCGAAWNTLQWLRVGGRILKRQHEIDQHRRLPGAA